MRKSTLLMILVLVLSLGAEETIPEHKFEKVISLRSMGSPAISPDGKSIVFTVRTVDWEKNRYDTEI